MRADGDSVCGGLGHQGPCLINEEPAAVEGAVMWAGPQGASEVGGLLGPSSDRPPDAPPPSSVTLAS